ncbi:MAG: PilZ domain-containing protein [Gammaproteobacteria bacterium]|nr:PilZ domain-containing protein [Gammaproteobacteria bacterium]
MEHRHSQRKPLCLPLVVRVPSVGMIRCTSNNLSREGVSVEFLEKRQVAALISRGDLIELAYFQVNEQVSQLIKVNMLVVYVKGNRMGLMFSDYDHKSYERLQQLISAYITQDYGAQEMSILPEQYKLESMQKNPS